MTTLTLKPASIRFLYVDGVWRRYPDDGYSLHPGAACVPAGDCGYPYYPMGTGNSGGVKAAVDFDTTGYEGQTATGEAWINVGINGYGAVIAVLSNGQEVHRFTIACGHVKTQFSVQVTSPTTTIQLLIAAYYLTGSGSDVTWEAQHLRVGDGSCDGPMHHLFGRLPGTFGFRLLLGGSHLECRDGSCVEVPGAQQDECAGDDACNHHVCDRGLCANVPTPGTSTCTDDCACRIHSVCEDDRCVWKTGCGTDQCTGDADCAAPPPPPPPTVPPPPPPPPVQPPPVTKYACRPDGACAEDSAGPWESAAACQANCTAPPPPPPPPPVDPPPDARPPSPPDPAMPIAAAAVYAGVWAAVAAALEVMRR